jgi:phosphoglycerate dehydrogenase-like enzyme
MGIKVLFTYDYGKEKMDMIEKLGYEVTIKREAGMKYTEDLKDAEILVCFNPFDTLDITPMISLKLILLSSIGIDQLPMGSVRTSNITICNNKGGYSIPMGEWIIMMLLELFKNSTGLYRNQLNKKWKIDTGILEIYGKTIGFIGTGTIAVEAARRLQGFGVSILGLNTMGKTVEHFTRCYPSERIDEMLSQCDAVVVSAPNTDKTYHLINRERFDAMRDNTVLVNIARGSIIDEEVMIEKLSSGKLKGAAQMYLQKSRFLWTILFGTWKM